MIVLTAIVFFLSVIVFVGLLAALLQKLANSLGQVTQIVNLEDEEYE